MLDNYITDFKRWASQPYREDGNVIDWILFVGVLTVATFLWSTVLRRIFND